MFIGSYVASYPHRPPKLRVLPQGGLDEAEVHHLSDMLQEQVIATRFVNMPGRRGAHRMCQQTGLLQAH